MCELLKALIPNKILFAIPNEKQKNDAKYTIDNYFKHNFSIKNIISLEDSDFQLALGNKRIFQSGPERKIEISELFMHYSKIGEIFNKFLTFTTKQISKSLLLNPYPKNTLLNRACNNYLDIDLQRSATEESLSLMIFIPEKNSKIREIFRNYDLSSIDEEVCSTAQSVEVTSFKFSGIKLTINIGNQEYILRAATVNDLYQLPNNPLKSSPTGDFYLYSFNQESFYKARRKPKFSLRILYENEINELFNIYFYKKSDSTIPIDCFPDTGKSNFKYQYVIIKDSIILNSGTFSKHFLAQIKSNDLKNHNSDTCLFKMCKWEGCMSSLVSENDLTKMITEFNTAANKAKNSNKKALNPLKKSRTASEAIIVMDLCIFHNNLRNILRNDGILIKNYIFDNSAEL